MLCSKCGKELEEGAMFCKYCGNLVSKEDGGNAGAGTSGRVPANAPQGSRKYLIPILCVAVVLIFIVGRKALSEISANGNGFSTYDDAVRALVSAMEHRDEEEYLQCFPKAVRGKISSEIADQAARENRRYISSPYQFLFVEPGYAMNYSILSSGAIAVNEIDAYNSKTGCHVTEGKYVSINVSHSDGNYSYGKPIKAFVGKIGKKWYILEPAIAEKGWPIY